MNLYGNYPLMSVGLNDPAFIESLSLSRYDDDEWISSLAEKSSNSPPKHRHDGTSPLPLGMDWTPPPCLSDSLTGWSYSATIPSWTIMLRPKSSATVVFYRVQIGIRSPEGFTTNREILRRFSDFLNLSSELKKEFPKKKLPASPSKGLLRMQSNELLEERRCILEHWMTKVLSDIELSRSAPIGIFLELEAAARSSFHELNRDVADVNSSISVTPPIQFSNGTDVSLLVGTSSFASDCGDESVYGTPDLGSPTEGTGRFHEFDNATPHQDFTYTEDPRLKHGHGKPAKDPEKNEENMSFTGNCSGVSTDIIAIGHEGIFNTSNSLKLEPLRNTSYDPTDGAENALPSSSLQLPGNLQVVIQLNEQSKMKRFFSTMQLRLTTAKTDMEDLQMRLNQELAVKHYLATKVKDLETELESLKQSGKENLELAVLTEKEKLTQMLWDMEELKRKCMDSERKLTWEQADKVQMESTQRCIVQEKEKLGEELDAAQQKIISLQEQHLESKSKSNAEVKLLAKEIKSLRSSHAELEQELSKLAKEKAEAGRILQEERQSREHANSLLHECEILRSRLEECSVNFLIEEENKLVLDASSPSDAIDMLLTSDNRIGLLLAEAQLLAQDIETTIASRNLDGSYSRTTVDDLRRLLADVYVDNAKVRKQMNAAIRYALQTANRAEDNEKKTAFTKCLSG